MSDRQNAPGLTRRLWRRVVPPWNGETNHDRTRRSWIGHLFRVWPIRGHYLIGSVAIAVVLYVGGLVAASFRPGLAHDYVHSSIWAFAAVTGWVLAWGEWSDRALYELPIRVAPAIRRPMDESEVDYWRGRFYDTPRDLFGGVILAAVFIWLVLAKQQFWAKRLDGWAVYPHVSKLILGILLVIGSFLASSMLYGFWNYVCFAHAVLRRELVADVEVAKASLLPLTSFGLATGFGWMIAVALAAEFIAHRATSYALGGLAVLALFGFALILVPQFLAHNALLRTRDDLFRATLPLTERAPGRWVNRFVLDPDERTDRVRAYLAELSTMRAWIYTPSQALFFVVQVTIALASIFVQHGSH